MKRSTLEALMGLLCAIIMLTVASLAAKAGTITLQPGESVTITAAQQGGPVTPPANVQCPDGSVHPPGYVCPVTPPSTGICAGFDKTLQIPINWAAPQRMLTANYGGFGANDAVVVSFTTGSGASQTNNLPRIAGAEYGAGAANRIVALSERACDFVGLGDYYSAQTSSAPTIPFTVANPYMFPGLYSNLKNNTTYYLNVKNAPGSGCTTTCDMFFDLSKNGTN